MHLARPAAVRLLALVSALTLTSSAALAQSPGPPPCSITQTPEVVYANEPFTLCGPEGDYFYNWYATTGGAHDHLTGDRCYDSPGLPVGTYHFEMDISNLPDNGEYSKCPVEVVVIERPKVEGRCWLTGGGGKVFEDGTGMPLHSYGGNINPGCSPTAGDGGSWNDVWHAENLHFHGQHIEVLRCGNVAGIPEGSTSPETPFNFIEFQGTGTLKGIRANKADFGTVHFFGRYEDRGEPGSRGESDPDARDRYFLHVYSNPADPAGSTLMLVDIDGDASTVDPLIVTTGNLQIHWQPCDEEVAAPSRASQAFEEPMVSLPAELSFAAPRPNPSMGPMTLRFALPREADVQLAIFDVTGRKVKDVAMGRAQAGVHDVAWDLSDARHQPVARGVYFARLIVDGQMLSRTLTVVR
jgi:hypothetical protein